jgi:putative sigma-54 modulation protein
MITKITARHFELTPEIKSLAEENFESLEKYFDNIINTQLILDVEKHRKKAELKMSVHGQTLTSTEVSDDMYVSIESVFDKARAQLIKYKGKLKNKNIREIDAVQDEAAKPKTDVEGVDF